MSPAGRTSGEWAAPVTQGEFSGFATEVRGFMAEQRTQNGVIMSMLAEGQSTMAVLRRDTAEYKNRSDEASSKIRLLAQSEAVRVDREKREETQALPVALPPKPTFWELIKDKLLGYAVLAACLIIYDVGRQWVIAHPALSPDGEGFSIPKKEHERGREPVQAAPVGIPANAPVPKPGP